MFTPLRFNGDGSVQPLDCSPEATFKVSHSAKITSNPTGKALAATDASPSIANVFIDSENILYYDSC